MSGRPPPAPPPRARAAREWGWYRLEDDWAQRVVEAAGVRPGELVLDLGAGTGALTAPLVDVGAAVIAVELHEDRVRVLRRRFAGAPVTVVRADIERLRLPGRPFRVVANPPYRLTSALVGRLRGHPRLLAADLVLQRAAGRSLASTASGGPARRHELTLGLRVPRRAFRPVPTVDSVVLRMRRR